LGLRGIRTPAKNHFGLAFPEGVPYNRFDEVNSSLKGTVRSWHLPMEDEGLSMRATLKIASHVPFPVSRSLL